MGTGRRATPPSGREWQGSQTGQSAAELVFPGPALGQMQGDAARLAGEVGSASGGVGAALPQSGHQHLTGSGGHGQQRVIAPLAGVAPVSSTGQAVVSAILLG